MGAQSIGKGGVIYSCFKAKGKNKGALRVVPSKRGCLRMRGWRPLSWSAIAGSSASGQGSAQGQQGPQGNPGPEGKEGSQGVAGTIEKTLVDTIQAQSLQIDELTEDVTDLAAGMTDLEGTVGDTCDQLELLTEQSNEILESLLGSTVAILGNLLNVPSPPDELAPFECT